MAVMLTADELAVRKAREIEDAMKKGVPLAKLSSMEPDPVDLYYAGKPYLIYELVRYGYKFSKSKQVAMLNLAAKHNDEGLMAYLREVGFNYAATSDFSEADKEAAYKVLCLKAYQDNMFMVRLMGETLEFGDTGHAEPLVAAILNGNLEMLNFLYSKMKIMPNNSVEEALVKAPSNNISDIYSNVLLMLEDAEQKAASTVAGRMAKTMVGSDAGNEFITKDGFYALIRDGGAAALKTVVAAFYKMFPNEGASALAYAALKGNKEAVDQLVEVGATLNTNSSGYKTRNFVALQSAIVLHKDPELLKMLLVAGGDINASPWHFYYAVMLEDKALIDTCLNAGAFIYDNLINSVQNPNISSYLTRVRNKRPGYIQYARSGLLQREQLVLMDIDTYLSGNSNAFEAAAIEYEEVPEMPIEDYIQAIQANSGLRQQAKRILKMRGPKADHADVEPVSSAGFLTAVKEGVISDNFITRVECAIKAGELQEAAGLMESTSELKYNPQPDSDIAKSILNTLGV